jgi:hypothetical protein
VAVYELSLVVGIVVVDSVRRKGGGERHVAYDKFSVVADEAKFSSSSFSSTMSSGIRSEGRSSLGDKGIESSERNRNSDSGEISRDRLLARLGLLVALRLLLLKLTLSAATLLLMLAQELTLRASSRTKSFSSRLDLRKNRRQVGVGESDRADVLRRRTVPGQESKRSVDWPGTGGAGRGVTNLSWGFIVM